MVDAPDRPERELELIGVVAIAWGGLAALPAVALARRWSAADRLRVLVPAGPTSPASEGLLVRAMRIARARCVSLPFLGSVVRVMRAPLRSRRRRALDDALARDVAVAVDLVAVGVGAGHTPYLAVQLGGRWAPPLVARELDAVARACSVGQSFDDALRELGTRCPNARGLAETLRTSARLGSPAAPALARLAAELRADLRRRAEARARTVPVKLCFPLVGCILPAFALLTVAPVLVAGVHG